MNMSNRNSNHGFCLLYLLGSILKSMEMKMEDGTRKRLGEFPVVDVINKWDLVVSK